VEHFDICWAVSPPAPAATMANSVATDNGDVTTLPTSSAISAACRSNPNALTDRAASTASASLNSPTNSTSLCPASPGRWT
jgi:hypothetical protein